jgi:hypothetical protein
MLAEPDEVYAQLVGEDCLIHHVAQHLRMGEKAAVSGSCDVAECVEPELDVLAQYFAR